MTLPLNELHAPWPTSERYTIFIFCRGEGMESSDSFKSPSELLRFLLPVTSPHSLAPSPKHIIVLRCLSCLKKNPPCSAAAPLSHLIPGNLGQSVHHLSRHPFSDLPPPNTPGLCPTLQELTLTAPSGGPTGQIQWLAAAQFHSAWPPSLKASVPLTLPPL